MEGVGRMKTVDPQLWRGRRVLVTGHSGFKGAWLSVWLHRMGAQVYGLALPPESGALHGLLPATIWVDQAWVDLQDVVAVAGTVRQWAPEIIFHLAAQPLVRRSHEQPGETFAVNVMGTIHLLEAVRGLPQACPVVLVTSDKCYRNEDLGIAFRETDPLGGHDPYSASKAAAEIVATSWYRSYFRDNPRLGGLATVRAGNVIGGGDFSVDRIVPDCVRAFAAGQEVVLRNPHATRPWQHVLDCLHGYLRVGEVLLTGAKPKSLLSYNFGPGPWGEETVGRLVEQFAAEWPGRWRVEATTHGAAEAGRLNLAIDRAVRELSWRPVWGFARAVAETAVWYRTWAEKGDSAAAAMLVSQMDRFKGEISA